MNFGHKKTVQTSNLVHGTVTRGLLPHHTGHPFSSARTSHEHAADIFRNVYYPDA